MAMSVDCQGDAAHHPSYGPLLRTFMQYLFAFCSRLEAASDVVSTGFVRLIVPEHFTAHCPILEEKNVEVGVRP